MALATLQACDSLPAAQQPGWRTAALFRVLRGMCDRSAAAPLDTPEHVLRLWLHELLRALQGVVGAPEQLFN
jgi:hypothetical protein